MSAAAAEVEALIRDLEDRRFRAMLDGDQDALRALLSDALVYTHTDGRRDTKDSYLATLDGGSPYVAIEHPVERIVVSGGAALVVGRMTATLRKGDVVSHLDNAVLSVWVREPAGWRFVAFQPTPLNR